MINADPVAYLDWTLTSSTLGRSLSVFPAGALASYRAQAADPVRIAALCAVYRAGVTIGRTLDDADCATGRRIKATLHLMWAEGGFPAQTGDPAGLWRQWADEVTDCGCESGHFVVEENPVAVIEAFLPYFQAK